MPSTCNKRPAELFGLRSKTEYGPQGNTMKKRKLWFRSPRPQLWPRNWRKTRKNPPVARATLASSYDAIFREAQQEHLTLLTGVVAPLATPTVTGVLVAVHTIVPVVASTIVPAIAPTIVPAIAPTIVPAIAPTVVPVVAPAIVPSSRKRSSAMTAEISTSHVKDGRFHPYLKTQSLLRSSNHTAPPVVTRSRSGASGSFNKETRDLAWYLRQSKTSTSQKRPTVSKPSFKVAGVMDATTAKDGTVHTSPQDTEQSRSSEGASKDQSAEKEVSQGRIPTRGEDARGDNTGDALSNESNRDDGDQGAGDDDDEDDQGGEVDEEGDEDEDDEDEYDHHQQSNDQDSLFSSGASMSGMVSGMSSRLQGILTNLRAYEDPFLQLIALQDLSLLLSVSTEDSLAEYFDCDAFV
ncbi:Ubiquitin fusion degradation protein 4 [Mortierella sp. GBA35]|nr:Ubiquitin fusion degradation protein 4 [Mortierella sp. GBA35]